MAQFDRWHPTDEIMGVTNYYSRGRRGKRGISVSSMSVDSEGKLYASFSNGEEQCLGEVPTIKGEDGKDGLNGRVVDIILDSESVVSSEGIAYLHTPEQIEYVAGENITISEGYVISAQVPEYVAGENVTIEDFTISAVDTKYTAGENIKIENSEISAIIPEYTAGKNIEINGYEINCTCQELVPGENITIDNGIISAVDTKYEAGAGCEIVDGVINVIQNEPLIGKEIIATVDVGGIKKGDVLPADMKLDELLDKLFNPTKPSEYEIWYGMFSAPEMSVSRASWSVEKVDSKVTNFEKTFNAVKQHIHVAVPKEMGRLTDTIQGGLHLGSDVFDEYNISVEGKPYYLYITNKLQGKIEFNLIFGGE